MNRSVQLMVATLLTVLVVVCGKPLTRSRFGQSNTIKRMAAAAFLGSCLPLYPVQSAYAGIDALDAANRAMHASVEKSESDGRDFNALPEGSKRRRAIAACKDKDLRVAAGYMSASKCTSDVIDGEYDTIAKAINGEVTVKKPRGKR